MIQPLSFLPSLVVQLSSPLSATTTLLSSLRHFSSSSPLFATAILYLPYATAILSLSLSATTTPLSPLCHYNSSILSLSATSALPLPSLPLQILSPPYATAILSPPTLSATTTPLYPLCHYNSSIFSLSATSALPLPSLPLQSYLLPMPLQSCLLPLFLPLQLFSPLFATTILSLSSLSATTTLLSSLTIQILSPLSTSFLSPGEPFF